MPKSSEARLLAEMVDKRIEARVAGLETTVQKIYVLFKKLKESSAQKRLAEMEKEFNSIKAILKEIDPKGLEADVFKRIGENQRKITQSIEDNRRAIGQLRDELSGSAVPFPKMAPAPRKEGSESISSDSLIRDLESLKTKTKWLELEMEKMNTPAILEKIKELENRINSIRISQPMIIE